MAKKVRKIAPKKILNRTKKRSTKTRYLPILIAITLISILAYIGYQSLFKRAQVAMIGTNSVLPNSSAYDVVVVGGGASGVAAAIQAARQGVSVALIEETDWLGGQMSAAAVSTMDEGIEGWQRDGGIYGEIYKKTKARYDSLGITQSTCYHWYDTNCPEPNAVRAAIGEIIAETQQKGAVLDVFTLTKVNQVIHSNSVVSGVKTTEGKTVYGKVVIDATEYGDLLPLSGVDYRIGNKTNKTIGDPTNQESTCIQDITYSAVIKKYPSLPQELKISTGSPSYTDNANRFRQVVSINGSPIFDYIHYPVDLNGHNGYRGMPDPEGGVKYYSNEYADGKITKTGINLANDYMTNARYLLDPAYRNSLNCKAKTKTIDFIRYIQTELQQPNWSVDLSQNYAGPYNSTHTCDGLPTSWAPIEQAMPVMPYVRESMRLIGLKTLGTKDVPASTNNYTTTHFDSAIAVADYGFDMHGCNGPSTIESDLDNSNDFHKNRIFQIPMETLIPEKVDGFLAAEKNISVSRTVNGAIRLQPTVMTIGQAAGSLAAHSIRLGTTPRHVSPNVVQLSLAQSKLRLSLELVTNVKSDHWAYPYLQTSLVHNITVYPSLIAPSGRTDFTHNISSEEPITRAEVSKILTNSASFDNSSIPTTPTFSDVPTTHPYYAYIEALYRAGITSGCNASPLMFCPDNNLTRAEMAVFMVNSLGLDAKAYQGKPSSFTDVLGSGGEWASAQIEAVYKNGIVAGCKTSPLSYCPTGNVTRDQSWVLGTRIFMYKTGQTK